MRADLLDCVVGLGAGLFYNSPMEAVVVTLRASKPADRKGKVLFINAANQVAREQAQSFLRESHQRTILNAYHGFADVEQFATVASLEQIADRSFNLAIPLYVSATDVAGVGAQIDVIKAVHAWRETARASKTAVVDARSLLQAEWSS